MSIDPARARRYFRTHYDMTFQGYHRARRMGLALSELRRGADMLDVGLRYGFESSSGFRDAFKQVFGEPPGRGRRAKCIVSAAIESPFGRLVGGATEDGVCLLEFADRRAFERQLATLRKRMDRAIVPGSNDHLAKLEDELHRYFEGRLQSFTVPLVAPGTPFQEAVWHELRRIPYGQTISYEALANAVGRPNACRAVGRANGDNRLAIVIPCHRVVQKNGELRGYGGGLWRKQFLLDLERNTTEHRSEGRRTVVSSAV
jgi:AraC family transcriptional regulator of adaptative response/methylated-DNA-[protein]-cysteine methyltransferase